MKHYYPSFYERFSCIAAACPDSCCRGWDVVIDRDTEEFYNTVPGGFGDRLRDAVYTDSDGDRVFRLAEDKKCPFWGRDKLCDIYRELGEEHLCSTCALFPRIHMEYEGFTELTLSAACPEAARLIVETADAYTRFTHTQAEGCADYGAEEMETLLSARLKAADILRSDTPLSERLEELLSYARRLQIELTGEDLAPRAAVPTELFRELEYIDESSRERIAAAASDSPDLSAHEKELENLAVYYLYRYFLGAIDTLDVYSVLRFSVISVRVIASLADRGTKLADAAQLYSKEIEQSYENMEKLLML